jgi:hypothetical protein
LHGKTRKACRTFTTVETWLFETPQQSCNKSVCVQENNKEYQILYEAEHDNRFVTNYPGEEINEDYEMDGTQYR